MKRNRSTADTDRTRKQPGFQIDIKLYARAKALAALREVRIGDIIDAALEEYLERQKDRI